MISKICIVKSAAFQMPRFLFLPVGDLPMNVYEDYPLS